MNQILSFEEKGIGRSMSNTVKFFAVSMIAFGVIIAAEGGYSLAKNRKQATSEVKTIEEAKNIVPEILFEQNNTKLNVIINGKEELESVSYIWSNDGIEKELLNVSSRRDVNSEIDIPKGTNTITVKVKYVNAPNFPYQISQSFTSSATKIKLSVVPVEQNMKMKISVEDEKGLESVKYRWNNEEEKTAKIPVDNNKTLDITTDIPFGQNTLTVTATNTFGEVSEKQQDVKGTAKPVINANLSADGKLLIEVTAVDNIENVTFKLNGEEFILNIKEFIEQGYTVEQLNTSPGLHLEANQGGKITKLTFEYQLDKESNEVEISAQTEYAKETVSGTLVKPSDQ